MSDDHAERYIDELIGMVESFRYELCELCGGDVEDHVFSPDPLGNPHAWCRNETEGN